MIKIEVLTKGRTARVNGKLMVNMLDGSGYFPDGEQLTGEEEKAFNHFIQLVEVTGISQSTYPEK